MLPYLKALISDWGETMQDVLLLVTVAVMFAFGWFLMGKLDCFLESNRHRQELQLSSGENALCLGFCNPTAADSITNVLEQCSKLYPENAEIPAHMQYNCKMVSLHYTPVMMKYGGLPIEPIADGHITQKVLWIGEAASAFAGCFVECLEAQFPAPTPGK